ITSAIGIVGEEELEIEQTAFDWQPGDRLMMCSDGLYGYLPQAVIEETMRKTHHVEATTEILLARTLRETEAGDNVTVICVGEA
ncbi:MAG: PP2C family protein-serine/threonine phosphatase, partial [Panacagrimonas sp.]